jgi:hypothetical protein
MSLGYIAIDQQYRNIPFHRHAEGKIDTREGLAVARQRARDYDYPGLARGGAPRQRLVDQWALDAAVVIGELAVSVLFRKVTTRTKSGVVDRYLPREVRRLVQVATREVRRNAVRGPVDGPVGNGFYLLLLEARNGLFDQAHVFIAD